MAIDLPEAGVPASSTDGAAVPTPDSEVSGVLHAAKEQSRTSRRDLLRRAGVAATAAGAAGGLMLLDKHRADAASGGNFILGNANAASSTTALTATTSNPAFKVIGTSVGVAIQGNGSNTSTVSIGIGVLGKATGGAWAVVGQSANAYDLSANGTGRLQQNAVAAGPPVSGSGSQEQVRDVNGQLWLSNGAGGWMPAAIGGLGAGLFTAEVTTQLTQTGSNGSTWVGMSAGLVLTLTPKFPAQAIISLNADLFTDTAGINQDIGVAVSGGGSPTSGLGYYPRVAGQPEAWKESGGFAGVFSPNAAFLQTVLPLRQGRAYTFTAVWKSNKPAPGGSKIWAGAGPIGGKFSPSRFTVQLVPDTHSNTGI